VIKTRRITTMKKTSEEREKEFRADFKALLEKHGAEFEVTDDGKSYGMHRGIACVTMMSVYNENNELAKDFSEFEL
jgi:hypothetical protein